MTRHRLLTLLTKITVTAKSFVGAIGGTLPLVFYNHIAYNFPEVLYRFCSVTISCHILFCQLPITINPSWVSFHMNESYRVHCYSQPKIGTGNTKQWSGQRVASRPKQRRSAKTGKHDIGFHLKLPLVPNNSKVETLKIFISPGNHKSSANQPLLILPNSDEQYNGKGKTGRPEIKITASYLQKVHLECLSPKQQLTK